MRKILAILVLVLLMSSCTQNIKSYDKETGALMMKLALNMETQPTAGVYTAKWLDDPRNVQLELNYQDGCIAILKKIEGVKPPRGFAELHKVVLQWCEEEKAAHENTKLYVTRGDIRYLKTALEHYQNALVKFSEIDKARYK